MQRWVQRWDPMLLRYGPSKGGPATTGHQRPGLRMAVKLPNSHGKEKNGPRRSANPERSNSVGGV